MSRVSDNLEIKSLLPAGKVGTPAAGGGTAITGLAKYRSLMWTTIAYETDARAGAELVLDLQESPKPTPNSISHGLTGAGDNRVAVGVGQTYTHIAIPFTADKDYTVYSVKMALGATGTPEGYFGCVITGDDSGSPDDANPLVGGQNVSITFPQRGDSLAEDLTEVEMVFEDGIDLTSGTDYWVVFTATDCVTGSIDVGSATVVGTGTAKTSANGTSWTAYASSNKQPYLKIMELDFTSFSTLAIDRSITIEKDYAEQFRVPVVRNFSLEDRDSVIRVYATNDAGATWRVSSEIAVGDSIVLPVA